MRQTKGRNAARVTELAEVSAADGVDVRGIEMDVQDQASVDAAAARIELEQGRLDVVAGPAGQRSFRVHIDPSGDGSDVVSTVYDRIRTEFYHRIGIPDLLPQQAGR